MGEQGFTEIETPVLISPLPRARVTTSCPRECSRQFFALPQSPQLFKQLCMIAGLDKYFQIARCFRDEDLRADRQPEFTQLDVEMSFATLEQFIRSSKDCSRACFALSRWSCRPVSRFSYAEVMTRFGSDKPDLR